MVLIGLGVWASRPPSRQPFQQPSDDAQGRPLETPGVSKEQFRAQLAQLCPRFAAISGGRPSGPPSWPRNSSAWSA
ncbi:hypothetical protein ACN28S_51675 [Cystobacter fuscus]